MFKHKSKSKKTCEKMYTRHEKNNCLFWFHGDFKITFKTMLFVWFYSKSLNENPYHLFKFRSHISFGILFYSILFFHSVAAEWCTDALWIGLYESLKRTGSNERLVCESNTTTRHIYGAQCLCEKHPSGPIHAVKASRRFWQRRIPFTHISSHYRSQTCLSLSLSEMKRTRGLDATEQCAVYKVTLFILTVHNNTIRTRFLAEMSRIISAQRSNSVSDNRCCVFLFKHSHALVFERIIQLLSCKPRYRFIISSHKKCNVLIYQFCINSTSKSISKIRCLLL